MQDADWEVLGVYIRDRANDVGLRDWTLVLKKDPPADAEALAQIYCIEGRKFATIRVCNEFRELSSDEQRQTILHELLHAHLANLNYVLANALGDTWKQGWELLKAPVRLEIEHAVDAMSEEWSQHFPHITWTTPDPTREESANTPYEGHVDAGS